MYRNRGRPKKPAEVPDPAPEEAIEEKNPKKRKGEKNIVTSTPLIVDPIDNNLPGTSAMNRSRYSARKCRSGEDDMFETPLKVARRSNRGSGREIPFPSPALSTIDRTTPGKRRVLSTEPSQPIVNDKQNAFVEQLKTSGLSLASDGPYVLDKDQPTFVNSLQLALTSDSCYPANISHFIDGFENFLNPNNLDKALKPTVTADNSSRKPPQECLVRLLLNVDCLQPRMWRILFDRMTELIVEEESNNESFDLVNKILRQIRGLDKVLEGESSNCDKLLELIALSTMEDTKREIILVIPDVICDEDREKVVLKISENLMLDHSLIPAYLETLAGILSATDAVRVKVINDVTEAMSIVGAKYFQVIMKFLFTVSDDMKPLIEGIRSNVKLNANATNKDGNEALLFANTLKDADYPKDLAEAWIKVMEGSESGELLTVDLVALLVFYSTRITRTNLAVVSAFKLQANRGPEAERDVDKALTNVIRVLEQEYLDSMMQILSPLFKSKVQAHSEYACFWYRLLMERIFSRHNSLKVLETILQLIRDGNADQVTAAIGILRDTSTHDMDSIARHAHRVVSLLQCIDDWELQQVRDLMSLLMSMIYGSTLAANQQDTVIIRIRKMLGISIFRWRSKGIVGAAAAVKFMPLEEAMRHVAFLLESSDSFSTEAKGLLYDELADAVRGLGNRSVIDRLAEQVMSSWEDTRGKVYYELEQAENAIAIPLVSTRKELNTICAHLRLCLTLLHRQNKLDTVDALLTAPVILSDLEEFTKNSPEDNKLSLDLLFHCVNLFRELVNGFSNDESKLPHIVQRLEHVVDIGKKIGQRLALLSDYTPPQCQFFAPAKPPLLSKPKTKGKGRPSKKKKKSEAADAGSSQCSTRETDMMEDEEVEVEADLVKVIDITLYRDFLRPLDISTITILKCDLIIDEDQRPTNSGDKALPCISPPIVKYVLAEFLLRLQSMFGRKHNPFGRVSSKLRGPALNPPELLILFKYCARITPKMVMKLDTLGKYCENQMEHCDGVYDALPLFEPGMADVKECHTLLLQCLLALLSWSELKNVRHEEVKNLFLKQLLLRTPGQSSSGNRWKETFAWFKRQADCIMYLPGAVALLQVLQALNSLKPVDCWTEEINKLSLNFLSRHWANLKGHRATGAEYNNDIRAVFAVYTNTLSADDSLLKVARLIEDTEEEVKDLKKPEGHLKSFVCITKSNFVIAYRVLFSSLIHAAGGAKSINDWVLIGNSLLHLSNIMKNHQTRPILNVYARQSMYMLQLYVTRALPFLSKNAKLKPVQFQEAMNSMQLCTRIVQRFVCEAKSSSKNVTLVKYNPRLRQLCENLIMRVKAAYTFAPDAFSVATLKNKNLKGDEILSQPMDEDDEDDPAAADSHLDDSASEAQEENTDEENADEENADEENAEGSSDEEVNDSTAF